MRINMDISDYKEKRYRRFKNTERKIKYRKSLIKKIWDIDQLNYVQENRLNKYNFTCNCLMCVLDKLFNSKDKMFKYKHGIFKYKNYLYDF